ncbi:MAG: tetratricopeptide repeat protein [bacterium]|nr:tetratricopeptide repeat protein [bacterium]
MKKLLFTLSLCALCASVSTLPCLAETPYAGSGDELTEISETADKDTNSEEEAAQLRQAGRDAFKKKDYATAVKYYQQAADLGDAEAQFYLANRYYHGQGVAEDKEQAFYWYEKAARQGNTDAQACLGECYLEGEGTTKNEDKGIYWLSLAADRGNLGAKMSFGLCYIEGTGVGVNPKHGFILVKDAAEHGLAAAQLYVGRFYCEGIGVDQDIEQGKKWFAKAAANTEEDYQDVAEIAKDILSEIKLREDCIAELNDLNNANAPLNEHENGDSEVSAASNELSKAINEAIYTYSDNLQFIPRIVMEAKSGNKQAAKALAEDRESVKKLRSVTKQSTNRLKMAAKGEFFIPAEIYTKTKKYDSLKPYDAFTRGKQACEKGDPQGYALLESSARRGCNHAKIVLAQALLPAGHKLNTGKWDSFVFEGKTLSEADRLQRYLKWMSSAADNGSLTACQELRQVYKEGTYAPKDSAKVFHYTKAAAQLKDPDAMFDLGTRYAAGIGCQKDRAAAVKWMKQAAHAGNADAQQWIEDRRGHYAEISGGGISSLGYVNFGDSLYSVKQANSDLTGSRINPAKFDVSTLSSSSQKVIVDNGYTGRVYYLSGNKVVKMVSEDTAWGNGHYSFDDSAWRNTFSSLRREIINAGYGFPSTDSSNYCEWHIQGLHVYLSYIKNSQYIKIKVEMTADSLRKWQGPKIGGWEDLLK